MCSDPADSAQSRAQEKHRNISKSYLENTLQPFSNKQAAFLQYQGSRGTFGCILPTFSCFIWFNPITG